MLEYERAVSDTPVLKLMYLMVPPDTVVDKAGDDPFTLPL
jgi:hypothetical protein